MDDTYDDGLVHSHNWASEPASPAKPMGPQTTASVSAGPAADESFDDGLVHGHDWARN